MSDAENLPTSPPWPSVFLRIGCALPALVVLLWILTPSIAAFFVGPLFLLAIIVAPVLVIAGIVGKLTNRTTTVTISMPLRCVSCGGAISPGAGFCRHCGADQRAMVAQRCPSCQTPLPDTAKFCGQCGLVTPLISFPCPSCAAPVSEGSDFCGNCGAPVSGAASE